MDRAPTTPAGESPGGERTERRSGQRETNQAKNAGEPRRVFLGWDQAPLPAAVAWVATNFTRNGAIDLSNHLVVIPSARARRGFLQKLHRLSRLKKLRLIPPEVATVGNFPELLYEAEQPFADQATRLMCWLAAFQSLPLAERQLFLPRLTASDFGAELSFAQQLVDLHSRLATEVRSFQSVSDHLKSRPELGDARRWEILALVQSSYYERLSRMEWWDLQAARSVAIHRQACKSDRELILIAASDLSESNRRMLRQVASQLTCVIAAPESLAPGFDAFGCLVPDYWIHFRQHIPDSIFRVVDRPTDQAFLVVDQLRQLQGKYSADEITIGVPDDRVVPQIELALRNEGLVPRRLEGESIEILPPTRLLTCIADFLGQESFALFAQLIRHPDVYSWLTSRLGRADWLGALDEYQSHFFSHRMTLSRLPDPGSEMANVQTVSQVQLAISELLRPLMVVGLGLQEYAEAWLAVLATIYGAETLGRGGASDCPVARRCDLEAAEFLRDAFEAIIEVSQNQPAETHPSQRLPDVKAADVLDWALKLLPARGPGDEARPDAIELVGWLDLPLDDTPVLIVTGMNEEAIRSQDPIVPLIPQALAESLGISRSKQRFARDLNALAMMTRWRQEVVLITGRHDAEGNPNLISRLLLSVDDELLVRRSQAFFSYTGELTRRRWLLKGNPPAAQQQLQIPRPSPVAFISQMSVTRFREYLKCPYRFYLGEVLKLRSVRDDFRELDGGSFGDLAHEVLEAFGTSAIRDSCDPTEIHTFFCQQLDAKLSKEHAGDWFAAVKVQIESLRERLRRFAEIQAERRASGWRIVAVEKLASYTFEVDGQPFRVTGRIDRIDENKDGMLAVWDYKTSDAGVTIEDAHRDGKGNWTDLQLPLYRYLIESVLPGAAKLRNQIQLGYILLPRTVNDIKFDLAAWTIDDLASADSLTRKVIGHIQRQEFWPPADSPPKYSEPFAAICQDGINESESLR